MTPSSLDFSIDFAALAPSAFNRGAMPTVLHWQLQLDYRRTCQRPHSSVDACRGFRQLHVAVALVGTVASIVNPYHIKDFARRPYHERAPRRTILGLWGNEP